jgi:hypothetical protein
MEIRPKEISLVESPAIRKKFFLIKERKMTVSEKELAELIENFLDENNVEVSKDLSPSDREEIAAAIALLNKYKGDLPDEFKAAIDVLLKFGITYGGSKGLKKSGHKWPSFFPED